jgi:hypothetical protein
VNQDPESYVGYKMRHIFCHIRQAMKTVTADIPTGSRHCFCSYLRDIIHSHNTSAEKSLPGEDLSVYQVKW